MLEDYRLLSDTDTRISVLLTPYVLCTAMTARPVSSIPANWAAIYHTSRTCVRGSEVSILAARDAPASGHAIQTFEIWTALEAFRRVQYCGTVTGLPPSPRLEGTVPRATGLARVAVPQTRDPVRVSTTAGGALGRRRGS